MGSRGNFYYGMHWVGGDRVGDAIGTIKLASVLGLAIYVLVGGFWNGFYGHILLATGYDVSSNVTIMLTVLNTTCNAFNNIPNGQQSASLCYQSYNGIQSAVSLSDIFATILPILLFIIAIVVLSSELFPDSWAIAGVFIVAIILSIVLNYVGYSIGFGLLGGTATIPVHTTSTTVTTTLSTTSTSSSISTTSTTTIIYKGTCKASSGFMCVNASLSQENKLNVILHQKIIPVMYNIHIGCGHTTQSSGLPNAQFSNETVNLTQGKLQSIRNLTCSGAKNGIFDGYIWLNYTRLPTRPSALNNSYFESEVASVSIP